MLKKDNISIAHIDRNLTAQKRKYFLGSVILHDISRIIKMREQKMYLVTFQKGTKTKLHYHESGQTLIATEGNGILVIYKKIGGTVRTNIKIKEFSKTSLRKGDVVFIPERTLHWHGSIDKKKIFSHLAINSHTPSGRESKTIWFDSNFTTFARRL